MDRDHAESSVMPNTDNSGNPLIRKPFVIFRWRIADPCKSAADGATTCADAAPASGCH